ncbi:hypothetical protein PBI_SCTP2_273 [Salicola phage SCTP-2]|nr:hypothetical protein PBI_SCTP2_273 [Salicola phage SCTP-2]
MNIFVTDVEPRQCAIEHNDVHLRKMIIETAQLLSTAHVVLDDNVVAYKKTHQNHPCAIWVRQSKENYAWTRHLLFELSKEYTYRSDRFHRTSRYIDNLDKIPSTLMFMSDYVSNEYPTQEDISKHFHEKSFVCAMPEKYITNNCFESYQEYLSIKYENWKHRWAYDKKSDSYKFKPIKVEWTKRNTPEWYFNEPVVLEYS